MAVKGKRGDLKPKKKKGLDPGADFNEPVKRPRQKRLPGTEDAAIEGLNALAEEYAEIRDKRQELTKQEVDLKGQILVVMHKNNKTSYHYQGVRIVITTEKEKVKVRITGKDADAESEE